MTVRTATPRGSNWVNSRVNLGEPKIALRPAEYGFRDGEQAGDRVGDDQGADAVIEFPGLDAIAERQPVALLVQLVVFVGEIQVGKGENGHQPDQDRKAQDRR